MGTLILVLPFINTLLCGIFGAILGAFYSGIIVIYLLLYAVELAVFAILKMIIYPTSIIVNYGICV